MSTTKIEKDGITAFKNFISESEIINPFVNENDKEPSWDGNLIIYMAPNHNEKKKNIKGRIPVQIKSTKIISNEKFSIEKSDLRNYLNDGGIILIRPIYITTTDYKIYIKLLLPLTILPILNNNDNDKKTISIELEKIDNIEKFEGYCHFFLEQAPLQKNYKNIIDIDTLIKHKFNIVANTFKLKSFEQAFLADECFFYCEIDNKIFSPVNLKLNEIKTEIIKNVTIDNKVYFEKINLINNKNSDSLIIEFNTSLKIEIQKEGKGTIYFNQNKDTYFNDFLISLNFLLELKSKKTFFIENQIYETNLLKFNIDFEKKIPLTNKINKFLKYFKFDTKNLKIGDIDTDLDKILNIYELVFDNKELGIENNPKQVLISTFNLLNKEIALFLIKQENGLYKVYNFFQKWPKYNHLIIYSDNKSEKLICSKYHALYDYKNIRPIDGYFEQVKTDLKKYFNIRILEQYTSFLLECLKVYDELGVKGFLELAETIIFIFKDNNVFDYEANKDTCYINELQIYKRKRELSKDEKKYLFQIKNSHPSDSYYVCCVNILLGYYEEFESSFEKLDNKKKKIFQSWPIWNLYKSQVQ